MKIYWKIYLIAIILISCYNIGLAQQTFPVTNTTGTGSGCLAFELQQAIDYAEAGGDAIVSFEAPGLVQVDQALQPISFSNSNGSITFQPTAGYTNQGITTSVADINGFTISNNMGEVAFYGLNFQGFSGYIAGTPENYYSAIKLDDARTVTIGDLSVSSMQCGFNGNGISIKVLSNAFDVNILGNSFTLGGGKACISIATVGDVSVNSTLTIEDNDFIGNSAAQEIGILCELRAQVDATFTFDGNTLEKFDYGIWHFYWDYTSYMTYNDYLTQVTFNDNTFLDNTQGLHISDPLENTVITNNIFTGNTNAIAFSHQGNPGEIGNSIIETINTLGYTDNNTGNVFNTPATDVSITCEGSSFQKYIELIALNLKGSVCVYGARRVIVRECEILNGIQDLPINIYSNGDLCGNFCIISPPIACATVESNELAFEIDFSSAPTPLSYFNPEFIVDFYVSNSNGDLVDYIGAYTLPAIQTQYSGSITIPGSITLNVGDRIAATLTSMGLSGIPAMGTSEAAYALIEASCCPASLTIQAPTTTCVGQEIQFSSNLGNNPNYAYSWNFGDGVGTSSYAEPSYIYPTAGTYTVTLTIPECSLSTTHTITVEPLEDCTDCADCLPSFSPIPGERYVISWWAKERKMTDTGEEDIYKVMEYDHHFMSVTLGGQPVQMSFLKISNIIDGWQKFEREFTVPLAATGDFVLSFYPSDRYILYLDDVRIFPDRGNMKAYVFDPFTLRLMAILDENNYATLYEYDEEGALTRVKKETYDGIKTIQEIQKELHKTKFGDY